MSLLLTFRKGQINKQNSFVLKKIKFLHNEIGLRGRNGHIARAYRVGQLYQRW
jgi:hypothetical protein